MSSSLSNRPGIALVVTLLVLVAMGSIAAAAAMLTMNTQVVTAVEERRGALEATAEAGLELGRAIINGDDRVPATGYTLLEDGVVPKDADGQPLTGIRRSTYAGPRGIATGQYGVFASIVSVAQSDAGERVVRRADVLQESFARYAYFTDVEPSSIAFGGGDQLFGPVHSNDRLRIYSSRATFHGPVTTARTMVDARYGTFRQGYQENVARIEMPTTADLDELRGLAAVGSMAFTASAGGDAGQSTLRLEFVALDVDNDGDAKGPDEGFVMAYASTDPAWVVASVPTTWRGLQDSNNCGHWHTTPDSLFVSAADHPLYGPDSKQASLSSSTRHCYLGGAAELSDGFEPIDSRGRWLPYPGPVSSELTARFGTLAAYLFPLARRFNPEFKGVIHVTGKVGVSGTLRGRVTLAATESIIVVDDLVYATDPSAPGREATCSDLLGLFSGGDVVVADNSLNAPVQPGGGSNWFTYDDTKDEFIHGTVLALDQFFVERWASGATRAERCESSLFGRGCLYLTGGIIQRERGAVGTIVSPGGTGYLKRYSYDRCAATMPPPYFPTTGHYFRDRYFSVDPVTFEVGDYFDLLAPGGS